MNKFWLPPKLQLITMNRPEYVLGHYVYEWRDNNIVFYVGMGTNRRAWNEHRPLPQERREASANFRINIHRQGLTKPQAHLIERYLTDRYRKLGLTLLNERIPHVGSDEKRFREYYHHHILGGGNQGNNQPRTRKPS